MNDWPANEDVLSRFQQWLEETRQEAEALEQRTDHHPKPEPSIGLYHFAEHLTALRHEVKLLTKGLRNTEERGEATIVSMQAAIEQMRAAPVQEQAAAEKSARPLVEALIQLDESLLRGRRALDAARRRILDESREELNSLRQQFEDLYKTQAWWRRWLIRPWHKAVCQIYSGASLPAQRSILDSLVEGYDLIGNRLRRTMDEQSIMRMQCVGRAADPTTMTVLEVVSDPSVPAGIVLEEVRPGYYWRGKVFTFAEVKVVGAP